MYSSYLGQQITLPNSMDLNGTWVDGGRSLPIVWARVSQLERNPRPTSEALQVLCRPPSTKAYFHQGEERLGRESFRSPGGPLAG